MNDKFRKTLDETVPTACLFVSTTLSAVEESRFENLPRANKRWSSERVFFILFGKWCRVVKQGLTSLSAGNAFVSPATYTTQPGERAVKEKVRGDIVDHCRVQEIRCIAQTDRGV